MGMQVHFNVADIPESFKVHKHSDLIDDNGDGTDTSMDSYIVVDPGSMYFNTDAKHESAWFDIGFMSEQGMVNLKWLIANRVCFTAS